MESVACVEGVWRGLSLCWLWRLANMEEEARVVEMLFRRSGRVVSGGGCVEDVGGGIMDGHWGVG